MTFRSDALSSQAETADRLAAPAVLAVALAVASAAVLAGAYFFEMVVTIPPCPLCTQQRIPHAIVIPLALVVAYAARRWASPRLVAAGFGAVALALLVSAGIGVFHAGVEWGFWPGPSDCTGEIAPFGHAGTLLSQIQATSVIRCDEVLWSFLGLSLAGWNALISLGLALLALYGLTRAVRQPA